MGPRLRLVVNIFSNWGGLAFSSLVSFLLAPYILRKLGDDGYGVWMLALSLTGYLGLLDLGIRTSVVRFVSKYKADSDYPRLNQIFNTALITYSLAGLLALFVGVILGLGADKVFNIPSQLAGEAAWVIILISATLAFSFGCGVFASTLVAIQRFDLINLASTVGNIFRAGLILLVFAFRANLVILGLISLVSSLVTFILIIYFALSREPNLRLNLKLASWDTSKKILNYGFYGFLIIVAGRVAYYSDNTVIGIFGSAADITYFSIGAIGVEFLRRLVNAFSSVTLPMASDLESRGSKESLTKLLIEGTKYTFLIVLPLGIILVTMGKTFLSVWMGPAYAAKSYIILVVLLLPQIYSLSQSVTEEILLGTGRHRLYSFVRMAEAIVNLTLSIILIKPFGILGVALGTSIAVVVFRIFLSPIFIAKISDLSFFSYLRESLSGPLAIGLPVMIVAFGLDQLLRSQTLYEFSLQTILLFLLYYLLAWSWVVDRKVKDLIINRMRNWRQK